MTYEERQAYEAATQRYAWMWITLTALTLIFRAAACAEHEADAKAHCCKSAEK